MSRHLALPLVLAAIMFASPAFGRRGPRVFEFKAAPSQTLEYVQGQQVALQEREFSGVGMQFVPSYDKRHAWIEVTVRNRGSKPVLVNATSLRASVGGNSLRVYTYQDLARAEHRAEMWRAVAAGLSAAGNSISAANAGYSNTYGTYDSQTNANAYGSGGYAYGSATTTGSFSSSTYSPGAALAAQNAADARNHQLMADMEAADQRDRSSLDARALRLDTIRPDGVITGQIMIDLPRKARRRAPPVSLQLSFTVGDDHYKFSLVEFSKKK